MSALCVNAPVLFPLRSATAGKTDVLSVSHGSTPEAVATCFALSTIADLAGAFSATQASNVEAAWLFNAPVTPATSV